MTQHLKILVQGLIDSNMLLDYDLMFNAVVLSEKKHELEDSAKELTQFSAQAEPLWEPYLVAAKCCSKLFKRIKRLAGLSSCFHFGVNDFLGLALKCASEIDKSPLRAEKEKVFDYLNAFLENLTSFIVPSLPRRDYTVFMTVIGVLRSRYLQRSFVPEAEFYDMLKQMIQLPLSEKSTMVS